MTTRSVASGAAGRSAAIKGKRLRSRPDSSTDGRGLWAHSQPTSDTWWSIMQYDGSERLVNEVTSSDDVNWRDRVREVLAMCV